MVTGKPKVESAYDMKTHTDAIRILTDILTDREIESFVQCRR